MKRREYLAICGTTMLSGCFAGRREGDRAERLPTEEPTESKRLGSTDGEYTLAFGEWFVHGLKATRIDSIRVSRNARGASGQTVSAKESQQFVFVTVTMKNIDDSTWRLGFLGDWAVIALGKKSDFGDYETVDGDKIGVPHWISSDWIQPDESREIPPGQKVRLWSVAAVSKSYETSDIEVGYVAGIDREDHNVRWEQDQ